MTNFIGEVAKLIGLTVIANVVVKTGAKALCEKVQSDKVTNLISRSRLELNSKRRTNPFRAVELKASLIHAHELREVSYVDNILGIVPGDISLRAEENATKELAGIKEVLAKEFGLEVVDEYFGIVA